MSSLCRTASGAAASAANLPTCTPPPELERGETAVAIDQAGLIVAAQPICIALFQRDPAELVGQPIEFLLAAGADKIRQELVPAQGAPDSESAFPPRHFALARRKDGACFAVAASLRQKAGCWWEVAFHGVEPARATRSNIRALGRARPASNPRRSRGQVAAPLDLQSIPDIFQRASAKPVPQPAPQAAAPAVAPEPRASADHLAPDAPAAPPAPPDANARIDELEQQLSHTATDLQRALAHLQQRDEQLHAASAAAQQATAALETETARRTRLQAELDQARQAGDELNQQLQAEQQARADSEVRLQELEKRLAQSADDLKRAQAQPAPQPAQATAPDPDQLALQDQLVDLESRLRFAVSSLARTTAELESERGEHQRLEAELLRSRADSARASRARVNDLRRQLQPPAEGLHQTACRLLQCQLSADQKQILQTMLENILLLQSALQESPAP